MNRINDFQATFPLIGFEKSSSSYFAKLEPISFIRVNECLAHFVSLQTKNVHRSVVDTVRAQV